MSLLSEVYEAKANGHKPRIHPNGFLQLDLRPDPGVRVAKRRLHIFDDHLPRQVVRTPIHDHIFEMSSYVVRGTIMNDTYLIDLTDDGEYEVHQAQELEGTETALRGTERRCNLRLKHTEYVYEGESYTFPIRAFHDSRHIGLTVTIMTKLGTEEGIKPRVLVPVGVEPDNAFSRERQDMDYLWDLIEFACRPDWQPNPEWNAQA